MKKYFIVFMGIASMHTAIAQKKSTNNEGISFGIRAGVDFTNINGKDAQGNKLTNKLKPGFNIGINAEIPIADEFYIQPNLLYAQKGAKKEYNIGNQTVTAKTTLSYIDVPIHFLYKGALGDHQILLGFGPSFSFGVGGKVKTTSNGTTISTKVKYKSTVPTNPEPNVTYVKPVDVGTSIMAGYGITDNVSIQLNAQLGLVNISPKIPNTTSNKSVLKNTGFGLSLGYRF